MWAYEMADKRPVYVNIFFVSGLSFWENILMKRLALKSLNVKLMVKFGVPSVYY